MNYISPFFNMNFGECLAFVNLSAEEVMIDDLIRKRMEYLQSIQFSKDNLVNGIFKKVITKRIESEALSGAFTKDISEDKGVDKNSLWYSIHRFEYQHPTLTKFLILGSAGVVFVLGVGTVWGFFAGTYYIMGPRTVIT